MTLINRKDNPEQTNFPSNIQEFINRRPEFKPLVLKARRMLRTTLGRNFQGGTAIGKNYNTLVLDLVYQRSDIYINCENETISIGNVVVNNSKEFLAEVSKIYQIIKN